MVSKLKELSKYQLQALKANARALGQGYTLIYYSKS